MMRIMFSLLMPLFFFIGAFSQATLPPAYQIKSDTILEQRIGPAFLQVLEDKSGKWTIGEILDSQLSNQFHDLKQKAADSIVTTHWVRFKLSNVMASDARMSLTTGSQRSDFYVIKNGISAGPYITGSSVAWDNKSGLKKANAIPFVLKPGEEVTIYQRRYNSTKGVLPSTLSIRMFSTEQLSQGELKDYEINYTKKESAYMGFLAGIFILAAILNFLIYLATRDKTQLYFSLFLFFFSLEGFNLLFIEIFARDNPAVIEIFDRLPDLSFVFFMFFIRYYFSVRTYYPRWDKFMQGIAVVLCLNLILAVSPLNAFPAFFTAGQIFFAFLLLAIIITVLLFLRKKSEQGKVFIIAVVPFIVCLISFLCIALLVMKDSPTEHQLFIGEFISGIAIVWAVIVFSAFLFKRYGQQEKQILKDQLEREKMINEKEKERNEFIAQQKIELEKQVAERTAELKQSLDELKSTQSQLIQSEKMASLGQLTAGIAHEIQNPLNFVNNFSDVNTELIEELKTEVQEGNKEEAIAIANDIKANEEKISHHGKRADAIVKGMLQHSRSSSGVKEPTDINALADEYLRLAYHGSRAKDKSFNATMKTDYDETIGDINIIPQDIGRVILNLITNAFYAVAERARQVGADYEPTVAVSTKKLNDNVEIRVEDNGAGIPEKILDKIFQPFFTTKPTGQGTGLGLSLSYDIVKAHGGEIEVETKEGEGTEFIIQIPTTK
ncbi:MAG: ATP-binding protein [Chitinophagaceae bacterium]